MRALAWLVVSVARSAPLPTALWLAGSIVIGLLVPAQLWLTKVLVDTLAVRLSGSGGDPTGWLIGLAAAIVVHRVLDDTHSWLSAELNEQAGAAVRERVMRKAASLPLAAFEDQAHYDRLNRIIGSAEGRAPNSVRRTIEVVRFLPQLLGYAVALAAVAPLLLVIVLVSWAPTLYMSYRGGLFHMALLSEQTRDRRLAEFYEGYLRWRVSAKEVRLYQLRDYLLGKWEALFWKTRKAQRALALQQGLKQRGVIVGGAVFSLGGLVWVVSAGLARATPGEYALLFQSWRGLAQVMLELSRAARVMTEQAKIAVEYRALVELPPETETNGRTSQGLKPFPSSLTRGISFRDVSFTYPGGTRPALEGITLDLRLGEKVALVGENGSGKTTLVKLLLGLYQPDAGRITVDGTDVREIDLRARRRAMSAVFQQFTHYQLVFAENVGLGQPERIADRPAIERATCLAGADEVVLALPHRYETVLGPDVGGVDLSGGQWQRVAVARAFFREAQVLVLDEPTAALDPLAELAVFERFIELAHGKTAVLISHRLGMAPLADRVVVLRDGRVAEQGAHDDLLRRGGEYAALFGAQARWYV